MLCLRSSNSAKNQDNNNEKGFDISLFHNGGYLNLLLKYIKKLT